MSEQMYPSSTRELALKRRELAPEISAAFHTLSQKVFAAGALSVKTKQIIAVAVAHVTQCPYCIRGHTKAALREGALNAELMEAIWVAAELRAGGSFAHSLLAIAEMEHAESGASNEQGGMKPAGEHNVAYAAGSGRS
jgi:AhpD family alkylhydroperoxidase